MNCIKPTRTNTALKLLAATAGCAGLIAAQAQEGPQPRLPTTRLSAGMHVIDTELAVTPAQQQIGMMFRTQMGRQRRHAVCQ